MTPEEMDNIAEILRKRQASVDTSQFRRALMRGETPNDPRGNPLKGAAWLDADPEWQKRFQEAYREISDRAGLQESRQQTHPEGYLRGLRDQPELGAYSPPGAGLYKGLTQKNWDKPYPRGGVTEDVALPDRQYPSPRQYPQGVGRWTKDWLDPLVALRERLNPESLARNLGSRVNAGPVGPWDFFPGGYEAYMEYLRSQGMNLPRFSAPGTEGEWL